MRTCVRDETGMLTGICCLTELASQYSFEY